ncbi:unnamed protein product [Spirodela intermedia]|uniref:Glycerol-3-phosphate acyltransferase RAM2/GPAT1-8 HAD-like domain-containing protein n=1 Tax=Spirodela intermedia TaxID=51605 RepID=A0A7I8L086_SPIIN|nr:unnamed protein product [Spirodela intermedia]
MRKEKRHFPAISSCDLTGREEHAVAADLDGTLLVSRSSFPYFMLLAMEAGGILRGVILLLASPLILFLYRLVSEAAGIQLLIFVSVAGLKIHRIEAAAAAVLPRFYAANVRADSWRAFRACGRRRVVVTANPTVMVEPFVKGWLGGDKVLGTELEVDRRTGRATGFLAGAGVLVAESKSDALLKEFAAEDLPELGLGDRETDHDFMALCKEGYMVPPDRSAARVPVEQLAGPVGFHDGRFVRRPEAITALLVFLWMPLGFALSLLRVLLHVTLPRRLRRHCYALTGVKLAVRGSPPPPPAAGSPGSLLVCNRRTPLDTLAVAAALGGRPISAASDGELVSALLQKGDVVVFPEETTCREPFLLRFPPSFAELSDRIVPVAIDAGADLFHGTTAAGGDGNSYLDAFFFLMNPRPTYEITFLDPFPEEWTCRGGKPATEVASLVQQLLAETLGFQCTAFTGKDKLTPLSLAREKVQ